jgi:hypothetical protein
VPPLYWLDVSQKILSFAADDKKTGDGDRDAEQAQAEVHGDDPIGASAYCICIYFL